MEAKPIAVIFFPSDYSLNKSASIVEPLHLMKELNGWDDNGNKHPTDFDNYLWFCFIDRNAEAPRLEVYNRKDFTDIEAGDLKEMVFKYLENNIKP